MPDGNGGVIQIDKTVETLVVTEVEDQYSIAEPQKASQPLAQVNDKVKIGATTNQVTNRAPVNHVPGAKSYR